MERQHLDWVLALKKKVNRNSHAMGIMVLQKFYYYDPNDYKYRCGDFGEQEDSFAKMWRMEDLNLQWNDLDQPYIPTLKDKLKKLFLGKCYPQMVRVRPKDNSLVILAYDGDDFYLTAEYNRYSWITELYFPIEPKKWAYIPDECIELSKSIIIQ